jgi:hypothetical protein
LIQIWLFCFFLGRFQTKKKKFNVLWLDPTNPDSFPAGFEDAMLIEEKTMMNASESTWSGESSNEERLRLRAQMRADALEPLDDDRDLPRDADFEGGPWSPETIDEAARFLRLNVSLLSRVPVCPHSNLQIPTPFSVSFFFFHSGI